MANGKWQRQRNKTGRDDGEDEENDAGTRKLVGGISVGQVVDFIVFRVEKCKPPISYCLGLLAAYSPRA
jgi:hypothetical protein